MALLRGNPSPPGSLEIPQSCSVRAITAAVAVLRRTKEKAKAFISASAGIFHRKKGECEKWSVARIRCFACKGGFTEHCFFLHGYSIRTVLSRLNLMRCERQRAYRLCMCEFYALFLCQMLLKLRGTSTFPKAGPAQRGS